MQPNDDAAEAPMNAADPDDRGSLQIWVWSGVALVVVLLLIALGLYVVALNPLPWRESSAAWGQLGDFVGGLFNPLIAFFALLGLAASLSVQQRTLRVTREGLQTQVRLQREQASQQTFFSLLELRARSVESVEWKGDEAAVHGRAAIKSILDALATVASGINVDDIKPDLEAWKVPLEVADQPKPYIALFAVLYAGRARSESAEWARAALSRPSAGERSQLLNLEAELGHVFRATYQVLKFVHRSPDFDNAKKADLINYLRAQMSEAEFALFALTALTTIGKKSRAAAIAFDLYEDRLLSTPWASGLADLFDPKKPENVAIATTLNFEPIFAVVES